MKKLLFIGIGSALMVTMGGVGTASADAGPHSIPMAQAGATGVIVANMGADQCANCHRAHTAKSDTLTLQAQPALCINCHNGAGSTLDVVNGIQTGTAGGGLRGGGFTNARIGSGLATKDMGALVGTRIATSNRTIPLLAVGQPVTSSHQIDGTTAGTMWGNGTTGVGQTAVTLECGSCHDPHGNGNYRILKPSPDGASYQITAAVPAGPGGVPAAVPAVMSATTVFTNIPDQPVKNYTVKTTRYPAGNYWDVQADNTPLVHLPGFAAPATDTTVGSNAVGTASNATDGFLGNIAAWCTTCHTRYLSTSASVKGDAVYTYKHRSNEGISDKPNCIQCHVSHGSNSAMTGAASAVTQPSDGTTAASASYSNGSLLRVDDRGICLECHNM